MVKRLKSGRIGRGKTNNDKTEEQGKTLREHNNGRGGTERIASLKKPVDVAVFPEAHLALRWSIRRTLAAQECNGRW